MLNSELVKCKKDATAQDASTIVKHKARSVTRRFQYFQGIEYNEALASIVKLTILPLFLAIVALENLVVHKLKMKDEFLKNNQSKAISLISPTSL